MSSASKPTIGGRPVEIERKYLITPPDGETMKRIMTCEGYDVSRIEQMYITGEHGEGGRIRRREYKDVCRYYYTLKQEINGLSRFETEYEISKDDYERLSKLMLEGTRPIRKYRHCFVYERQLFELDVYDFDESFATLEIELESEDQQVTLPDFIDVTADVTGDKRFRNFTIAQLGYAF